MFSISKHWIQSNHNIEMIENKYGDDIWIPFVVHRLEGEIYSLLRSENHELEGI
jgi:hypothetical protein